jgi:hypothetical protein
MMASTGFRMTVGAMAAARGRAAPDGTLAVTAVLLR